MNTDAFPACDQPAAPLDGDWPERSPATLVDCPRGFPVPVGFDCEQAGVVTEECLHCPLTPGRG